MARALKASPLPDPFFVRLERVSTKKILSYDELLLSATTAPDTPASGAIVHCMIAVREDSNALRNCQAWAEWTVRTPLPNRVVWSARRPQPRVRPIAQKCLSARGPNGGKFRAFAALPLPLIDSLWRVFAHSVTGDSALAARLDSDSSEHAQWGADGCIAQPKPLSRL